MKHLKMLLPCFLALLAPALAQAGDFGNLALATMYGYGGNWNNRPVVVNHFTQPYFALHPPVYYGHRYYRPYGESPFASWPQLQPNPNYSPQLGATHSACRAVAVTIQNPHFNPAPAAPGIFYPAPAAPALQPSTIPQPPQAPQLNIEQPKNEQPAQPAKVPDVVNRGVGPITIENPFFKPSLEQYISKQ